MSAKIDSRQIISISADVKRAMLDACAKDIDIAATILTDAVKNGSKILWCGNGGSAADAQHMATELMGGLRVHDRPAIASIALTTDSSFLRHGLMIQISIQYFPGSLMAWERLAMCLLPFPPVVTQKILFKPLKRRRKWIWL